MSQDSIQQVTIITSNISERNAGNVYAQIAPGTTFHAVVEEQINPDTKIVEKVFRAGNRILPVEVPETLKAGTEVLISFEQDKSELIAKIKVLMNTPEKLEDVLLKLLKNTPAVSENSIDNQLRELKNLLKAQTFGQLSPELLSVEVSHQLTLQDALKDLFMNLKLDDGNAGKILLQIGKLLGENPLVETEIQKLTELNQQVGKVLELFSKRPPTEIVGEYEPVNFPQELERALNNLKLSTSQNWTDTNVTKTPSQINAVMQPLFENQIEKLARRITETALEIGELVKALEKHSGDKKIVSLVAQIHENISTILLTNKNANLDKETLEKVLGALPNILNGFHQQDSGIISDNVKDSSKLKAQLYLLHAELLLALTTTEGAPTHGSTPLSTQEVLLHALPRIQKLLAEYSKELGGLSNTELTTLMKNVSYILQTETQKLPLVSALMQLQDMISRFLIASDEVTVKKDQKNANAKSIAAKDIKNLAQKLDSDLLSTQQTSQQLHALQDLMQSYSLTQKLSSMFDVLGEPAFILFPTLFSNLLGKAEVSWQRPKAPDYLEEDKKKGKPKEQHNKLQLTTTLPNLGEIGITLLYSENFVDLTFITKDEGCSSKIKENLQELFNKLTILGFKKVSANIRVDEIPEVKPTWLKALTVGNEVIA